MQALETDPISGMPLFDPNFPLTSAGGILSPIIGKLGDIFTIQSVLMILV